MNIPSPLLEDIASGKCLPFIGAGFSLNAKLPENKSMPDWPALIKILARSEGTTKKAEGPEIASDYERNFGRVQLIEAIRQALFTDVVEPGNAQKEFAQLPFDTIYTTNFDLLLEESYSLIRRPYRSLVGELQIPFHGGPLITNIVKMHGDLRHEEHMIITKDDYDEYLDKYPVISTHLSAMLITRTALFIGYSLADPDFNHIREVIRSRLGKFQRMSYIIQFNQTNKAVDEMLDQRLHVINIKVKSSDSIDGSLASFFQNIQKELDIKAGKKLRKSRPEIFEDISQEIVEKSSRSPDASMLLTSSSNMCFVLMPFNDSFNFIYKQVIYPSIIGAGLEALRADEIFSPGSIMEQIRSAIQQSRVCIADLTGMNPNVLYELGIAQTLGKPIILMAQDLEDVPFDLKQMRVIPYATTAKGLEDTQKRLKLSLQSVLGHDRLDEARQLIENGMIRAAVAILGVLLEHSLRHIIIKNELVDIKNRDHFARSFSIGKMVDMLFKANLINKQEFTHLKESTVIRNRAVHDLKEPKNQDAKKVLKYIEDFIRKYIGNAEQSN